MREPKQIEENIKIFAKKIERTKKEVEKNDNINKTKSKKCIYCVLPFSEIVISANGLSSPCCIYNNFTKEGLSDNITNKKLIDVWMGEKFNKFRTLLLNSKHPKECLHCFPDTKIYNNKLKNIKKVNISSFE